MPRVFEYAFSKENPALKSKDTLKISNIAAKQASLSYYSFYLCVLLLLVQYSNRHVGLIC